MSKAPYIIVKRVKKVIAGGHHGGAWKVAYADFVTAMMAFFLLMWLLNATTEDQRKGIADYFNPTIPISQMSGGGTDALSGASVFSEDELAKDGSGGLKTLPEITPRADLETRAKPKTAGKEAAENRMLEKIESDLLKRALADDAGELARHIQTRMTPDGLVIELVDVDDKPLFAVGSARPSPTMERLLAVVAQAIGIVENKLAIVGHTDGLAYAPQAAYTNWELSIDRANAARRLMAENGLGMDQVAQVSGKADTTPLTADKLAPQNRRISITLLRDQF